MGLDLHIGRLSEEGDIAARNAAIENEYAISRARAQAAKENPELIATGKCLYCSESVGAAELFCDTECHADFIKEAKDHLRKIRA